jgi:hypothetical protein
MEWIGCVRCEKSWRDFVAPCFSSSFMQLRNDPNAPKHYGTGENMSLGTTGVDWVCSLRKIPTLLRGTNFCINCTVHPVLHRVSRSYEMIPNASHHYATYQNMSLGSNGADWVRSLWKIPMWLRGMNFCINCTSSPYFAPSFMQLRNVPKCSQTLCNSPKHEFRVQCGGLGAFIAKNPDVTSWHELMH